MELYKRSTKKASWLKPLSKAEIAQKDKLEEKLSYEDIVYFRSLGDAELKTEMANRKAAEAHKKKSRGWFGGIVWD